MHSPFDIKHFPLLLKGQLYFPSELWLQKQLTRHHKKGPQVAGRWRRRCLTPKEKYLHFIKIILLLHLNKHFTGSINIVLATHRCWLNCCISTGLKVNRLHGARRVPRLQVTAEARWRCEDVFTLTPAAPAAANSSWLQVVFVSNESMLIWAWPQCKLPWCFTDVAC